MELCGCGRKKDYRAKRCSFCVKKFDYTPEEDQIIIKHFFKKSSLDISKMIQRSPSSIRHRTVKLGITNNTKSRSYKYKKYAGIRGKIREKAPHWKGGKMTNKEGYILIYLPNHPKTNSKGYVSEHRLVVEKKLGRPLERKEVVHHIDFNPSNNQIENLMLFSSQSKHMSFHQKIKKFGMTNPIRRQIKERWDII